MSRTMFPSLQPGNSTDKTTALSLLRHGMTCYTRTWLGLPCTCTSPPSLQFERSEMLTSVDRQPDKAPPPTKKKTHKENQGLPGQCPLSRRRRPPWPAKLQMFRGQSDFPYTSPPPSAVALAFRQRRSIRLQAAYSCIVPPFPHGFDKTDHMPGLYWVCFRLRYKLHTGIT